MDKDSPRGHEKENKTNQENKESKENLGAKIVRGVVTGVKTGARTVSALGIQLGKSSAPKAPPRRQRTKLLVSVVNYDDAARFKQLLDEESAALGLTFAGTGTAHSAVLDYLGIGTTQKAVMLSLLPENDERAVLKAIRREFSRYRAGKGISFTVPLSGISEIVSNGLTGAAAEKNTEGYRIMKDGDRTYDLIVVSVAAGHVDEAMEAARSAGAAGGTILRARSLGNEKAEQFIGINLAAEQEILLILAKREGKAAIMQALSDRVGLKSEAGGVIFSLPVDRTAGISAADEEAEERSGERQQ